MAFGKDPNQLSSMPPHGGNYIQRQKTVARRPARTGGGNAFYWKDTYNPPDLSTDIIRLVPGEYAQEVTYDGETIVTDTFPYFMFREHHNGKRGAICSGGALWANKEKSGTCPSCVVFWEDVRERQAKKARGDTTKGPNRMSCRDQFAFNVWDYGLYFEVPEVDKSGQLRMNQKTNQPFTHWVKGAANDPRMQGRPWKQGHLSAWPMATTYKDTLFNLAKQIGKSCKSCGSRDSIHTVMKICGNPDCRQIIYDPNNTALTDEQREQIDNYPYSCPHCGQTTFVSEVIECSHCQNPVRATLFDVDLQLQRMGTKGQQTFLQVFSWSDPRPIQVADPEILKGIVPLDLPKKFAPTPPDVQLKMFGLTVSVPTSGPSAPPIVGQQPMSAPQYPAPQMPGMAAPGPVPGPSMGMAPGGFPAPQQPPQQGYAVPQQPVPPQYAPPPQQGYQAPYTPPQPQPVQQAPVMQYPPMNPPGGNPGPQQQ